MLVCSACGKETRNLGLTHCEDCGGTIVIATASNPSECGTESGN